MPIDVGQGTTYLYTQETLDAAQEAVTLANLRGAGAVSVQLAGTFTATVTFEVSNDGTNWVEVELTTPAGAAPATTATTAGIYCGPVAGHFKFRARCSAYTSGSIVATVSTSPAGFAVL